MPLISGVPHCALDTLCSGLAALRARALARVDSEEGRGVAFRTMEGPISSLGEEGLIRLFCEPAAPPGELLVPNGDDAAAYVEAPGSATVLTTDTLVEGVHFDLAYADAVSVGEKLIAVNLSDLAAMGARPRYALLSLAMSPDTFIDVAEGIARGVRRALDARGAFVIGGNTTRIRGPMVLTAVLIGRAPSSRVITRTGTREGDALFVTGTLGDARAGLLVAEEMGRPLPSDTRARLFDALTRPTARTEAGMALAETGVVHAMCDVSDGLGRDLRRLLEPVGLGAIVDVASVPCSSALRAYAGAAAEVMALAGGEDYELLLTAAAEDEASIREACAQSGTEVSKIGTITRAEVLVRKRDGALEALPEGFVHF